jgi:hypothetical protein
MVRRLTQGVLRILRLCSGMLTLSSGQSSSCSRSLTKTELAKRKTNPECKGILAESSVDFRERSDLQRISDPGIIPAEVTITNQGFRIGNMLSDGEGEYLLNLDYTAGSYDSVIGLTGMIVIRLARTAHGYSVCAAPIQ